MSDGPATAVFQAGSELGEQQWEDFRKRVIEHVRTLTTYHVTTSRVRTGFLVCVWGGGETDSMQTTPF